MPARYTVGTVEITRAPDAPHATLKVWNRGGLAGELTVAWQDASVIAKRLLGAGGSDNPIKSEMHALDESGERIVAPGPQPGDIAQAVAGGGTVIHDGLGTEEATDDPEVVAAAEKAKLAMATATRVVRMSIDVEALGT